MDIDVKIGIKEAFVLREQVYLNQINFVKDMADIYGCHPLKTNTFDFYCFLATIFNAGRVSGIRQERERRRNKRG